MQFTKQDQQYLENIMKALRGGTFSFTGLEVLAFSDCMRWASRLHETMTIEMALAEQAKSIQPQGSPFQESPIKPIEPPKASKRKK